MNLELLWLVDEGTPWAIIVGNATKYVNINSMVGSVDPVVDCLLFLDSLHKMILPMYYVCYAKICRTQLVAEMDVHLSCICSCNFCKFISTSSHLYIPNSNYNYCCQKQGSSLINLPPKSMSLMTLETALYDEN